MQQGNYNQIAQDDVRCRPTAAEQAFLARHEWTWCVACADRALLAAEEDKTFGDVLFRRGELAQALEDTWNDTKFALSMWRMILQIPDNSLAEGVLQQQRRIEALRQAARRELANSTKTREQDPEGAYK